MTTFTEYVYDHIYIVNMKEKGMKHGHERMNTRVQIKKLYECEFGFTGFDGF